MRWLQSLHRVTMDLVWKRILKWVNGATATLQTGALCWPPNLRLIGSLLTEEEFRQQLWKWGCNIWCVSGIVKWVYRSGKTSKWSVRMKLEPNLKNSIYWVWHLKRFGEKFMKLSCSEISIFLLRKYIVGGCDVEVHLRKGAGLCAKPRRFSQMLLATWDG
jgi:hypothetical protein